MLIYILKSFLMEDKLGCEDSVIVLPELFMDSYPV